MNDFLRAFRRCTYLAAMLVFVPLPYRSLLAFILLVVYYIETRKSNLTYSEKAHRSEEPLAVRSLPSWVAWLLVLEFSPLMVSIRSLTGEKELVVYRHFWSLRDTTEQATVSPWWHMLFSIGLFCLVIIPSVLIVTLPVSLSLDIAMFGTQLLLLWLLQAVINRYLRDDFTEPLNYSQQKNTRTYISYLPREGTPAFARRTLRQQEIYLGIRTLRTTSQIVPQVLQAHEQGHIILGHTTLLFYLRQLRTLTIIATLVAAGSLPATLTNASGPLAALALAIFVLLLVLPELVQFLAQTAWERSADNWAAEHVGQNNVYLVRSQLKSGY